MNSKKAYFIMLGSVGVLGIVFVASVFFGEQLLRDQSQKLMSLKLDNQLLDNQQTALVKANKDLQQYAELGVLARTIVPQDKDQAKTVREILNIAAANNIPITTLSFPSSNLGAAVVKTTPVQPAADGSTPATPAAPAAPPVTQVKPVDGIKGLYKMEIIVQTDPSSPRPYANLQQFLHSIEQNRRTAQISQLVITPSAKDINLLAFSLTINVFVKP